MGLTQTSFPPAELPRVCWIDDPKKQKSYSVHQQRRAQCLLDSQSLQLGLNPTND